MLVKEGRILCMATCDNYIIVGTKKGLIIVYDGALKERSHCLEQLDDSVLCIKLVTSSDILVAGLANGNLAVYKASHLVLRGKLLFHIRTYYQQRTDLRLNILIPFCPFRYTGQNRNT